MSANARLDTKDEWADYALVWNNIPPVNWDALDESADNCVIEKPPTSARRLSRPN
jgi:hypothetical protein